ncbi:hypothetical protein E2320_000858, partial [Naja naja]
MGCTLSSTGDAADPAVSEDRGGSALALEAKGTDPGSHGERKEAFPLSEAQKERVRESWNVLHKNIARVGIIVFIGVMSFIEKSVARLDQEDKLEILAFELGKNHFHYKAPPNYYE